MSEISDVNEEEAELTFQAPVTVQENLETDRPFLDHDELYTQTSGMQELDKELKRK